MDWADIFADRQKFPDETKITGPDGSEMTIGAMRKSLGLTSEFTKHTQQLSEESKRYKSDLENHQRALQERERLLAITQQQLAQTMENRGVDPSHAKGDDLELFRNDPSFSPLVKLIDSLKGAIGKLEQSNQALVTRIQQDETAINAWRYQTQFEKLKERDSSLNTEKLAKFAQDFYSRGVDLDATHKLMTYDDTLKAREAEAEKRGYEKAKAEAPAPPMPGGGRGRSTAPPPVTLPKTLDERMTLAEQDPAVMEGFELGLAELQGR